MIAMMGLDDQAEVQPLDSPRGPNPDSPADVKERWDRYVNYVTCLQLDLGVGVKWDGTPMIGKDEIEDVTRALMPFEGDIQFVKGAVESRDLLESEEMKGDACK